MSFTEFISRYFVKIQWAIGLISAFIFIRMLRSSQTSSHFKVREADRADLNRLKGGPDLAQAKIAKKEPPPPPLALPGTRTEGLAHEILGIDEHASEIEIMKAYKDAIKRYHPDRIQGPAQEQLQFYQHLSAKLNQAKDEMLKRRRSRD